MNEMYQHIPVKCLLLCVVFVHLSVFPVVWAIVMANVNSEMALKFSIRRDDIHLLICTANPDPDQSNIKNDAQSSQIIIIIIDVRRERHRTILFIGMSNVKLLK